MVRGTVWLAAVIGLIVSAFAVAASWPPEAVAAHGARTMPEPLSLLLIGVVLLGFGLMRRSRRE